VQTKDFHQAKSEKEALNILLLDMQDTVIRGGSRFDELAANKLHLEGRIHELESKIIIESSHSLELVESAGTMNDRIVELENQLLDSKAESDLLTSMNMTADSRIKDLEEMSKQDEAASLIVQTDTVVLKRSYEALTTEKMACDDQITAHEDQAETDKVQLEELQMSIASFRSRTLELEGVILGEQSLFKSMKAQLGIYMYTYIYT
jgi:chromosome segregation ATPase